jgi:hypothetical protein
LYLYDIKIKINIKQKFNRKICGKVTDFFGLGRTWPNHFGSGCSCSAQKTVEKLFIVHVNSGEGIDAREREKGGGGKGWGKADLAAVLTVTLVVLLPNEAVVHWGATSPTDGSSSTSSSSSSSSVCAFPLVLLPLFFLFSLSLLLLLLLSVFFPFLSFLFGYFF